MKRKRIAALVAIIASSVSARLIAVVFATVLLWIGCSKTDMAQVRAQVDRDAVRIVQRYKAASPSEVESAMNDHLSLADAYEKRGWAKYGSPGWIEEMRTLCEGRLAIFFKASGKQDLYKIHLDRAVAHLRKSSPRVSGADAEVAATLEQMVNHMDTKIDPIWRRQLRQSDGAANESQPVGSETNRATPAAGSGG